MKRMQTLLTLTTILLGSSCASATNVLLTSDGTSSTGYFRLDVPGGILLSDILSLTYEAKITTAGPGNFAPSLILNIDADNSGGIDTTGIEKFNLATNNYLTDFSGDNFMAHDQGPSGAGVPQGPDADFVSRNVLIGQSDPQQFTFFTADAVGTGFGFYGNSALGNLIDATTGDATTVANLAGDGIDVATDKVFSIDVVLGGSPNFAGMEAIVKSITLNGTSHEEGDPDISFGVEGTGPTASPFEEPENDSVPEPSSWMLVSLMSMLLLRRRRRPE